MKKNLIFILLLSFSLHSFAKEMLLEKGKEFIYYQRYESAIETLKKYIVEKPKDPKGYFYLALSYIRLRKYEDARQVLDEGVKQKYNAPMLLVGYGILDLQDNKYEEAKTFFDNAIVASRQKDIEVYTQIIEANSLYRIGDPNFVLTRLQDMKQSTKKTPQFYIALGDIYRKILDGSNAVVNYTTAYQLDHKLAEAKYKIGRIYITQGNFEVFNSFFQDAIKIDPKYAPVYYELYRYYYKRDINKAREYFEKYKANTDQGSRIEYEYASLLYAAKSYQESLDSVLSLIERYPDDIDPRWYGLMSYCYDKLGEKKKLYEATKKYEELEDEEYIDPEVLEVTAENYVQNPETFDSGIVYYQKAFDYDTSSVNKTKYLQLIANAYKEAGNRNKQAYWLGVVYNQKQEPTYSDLYNWGIAAYLAKDYRLSDSVFAVYTEKYPDQYVGYYWRGRNNTLLDTTFTEAIPYFKKYIEIAAVDSIKNKSALITAYGIMASYNVNTVQDFPAAIGFFDKILYLDPKNEQANTYKNYIVDVIKKTEEYEEKKAAYDAAQKAKQKE